MKSARSPGFVALAFALIAVIGTIIYRSPHSTFIHQSMVAAQSKLPRAAEPKRQIQKADATTSAKVVESYGKLPLLFEANHGQTDPRVKFISRGGGLTAFLTADEVVLKLRKAGKESGGVSSSPESSVLRMKLIGANRAPRVSGVEQTRTMSNYFLGNDRRAWRTNVRNYSRVEYEDVYPGIGVAWYGNGQRLEHDFIIAPGIDPQQIKLAFAGAESMKVDEGGSLRLSVDGAEARLLKPRAWQEVDGQLHEVACDYRLNEKRQVEFQLGEYDSGKQLTIDPILAYSTYLGGAGQDQAFGIAVDGTGAAYITGQTNSTDFPGQSPIQQTKGASYDAFVLKLNAAGNAVIYATWLGGVGNDVGNEIVVDSAGNAYVVGTTFSTDFPLKDAIQNSLKGPSDAFVTKLNPAGAALVYSTYLGGSAPDQGLGLALDAVDNAYLTGSTESSDFPTSNAIQPDKKGSAVYFSSNASNSWNEAGTGLGVPLVYDLAIDPQTPATIYAGTDRGVFKTTNGGGAWAQVGANQLNLASTQVVVDPVTTANVYAISFFNLYKSADGGGNWVKLGNFSAVQTLAIDPVTPTTLYLTTLSPSTGFKSTDGGATWTPITPIYLTFPGGPEQPRIYAVDPLTPTTVYVGTNRGFFKSTDSGTTWQPQLNGLIGSFPFTVNLLVISRSNPSVLYAATNFGVVYKTTDGGANWTRVNFSANIGGTPQALAIDPTDPNTVYFGMNTGEIYKTTDGGATWNVNRTFYGLSVRTIAIVQGAPSMMYVGKNIGTDVFVTKINAAGSALVYSTYLGGASGETGNGITVDVDGNAYIAGSTLSPTFPLAAAFQPTLQGVVDAFVAKLNAAGSALVWSTYLGGSDVDSATGIAVNAAGNAFVTGNTTSNNFPTAHPVQASNRSTAQNLPDAFITRFSADGANLDYSTYLGGADYDSAAAIAIDAAGNAYVTGQTNSTDFSTVNAPQPVRSGDPAFSNTDAFVTKLSADGSSFIYSTFLGGNSSDRGDAIAIDAFGNAYVTGVAFSTDFPTTPNPLRTAGPNDSFVTKLSISADLAISMSDLTDPIMVNRQLVYTLTITNNGPDPASAVTVTDTLAAGVNFVSASSTQGTCSGSGPVNCDIGSITPNGKVTITITITPTAAGTITNSASVTGATPDVNTTNNSATQETKVSTLPSIFGRVTLGGEPLGGVTVTLTGAQRPAVTTAADGNYQFEELPAGGDYTITPSRFGYVFNPPSIPFNNLTTDEWGDFAAVTCVFTIAPRNSSFPATGGAGGVTITGPDAQCPWTARSNVDWIEITSSTSGNGNGAISFTVAPTVGSRNGTILVAGNVFTVRQEFNACGSAGFSLPQTIPLTGYEVLPRVAINDFNGDGKPDPAFIVSSDQKGVAVTLSNGQGGYGTPVKLLTDIDYRSLHTADLNRDGKADLVATYGEGNGSVVVLLGNGAGGFASATSYVTGPRPGWAVIADFNSDNNPDLAVATRSFSSDPLPVNQNVSILLGTGTGAFGAAMNLSLPIPVSVLVQFEAADFTGDGKTDIVLLNHIGVLSVAPGKGDGTFDTLRNTFTNTGFFGWMAVGDFDGNKKLDIAVVSSTWSDLKIYLNDGAGNFGSPVTTSSLYTTNAIAANDFNGDGKSDLAITQTDGFAVYLATTGGNFAPPVKYFTGVVIPSPQSGQTGPLASADYNRDGRPDLFVPIFLKSTSGNSAALAVVTSTAGGGFAAPRNFIFSSGQSSFDFDQLSAVTGDIDGDGVLDLVVAGTNFTVNSNNIYVMLGNGRGEFGDPVAYSAGQYPQFLALRDFNGDGRLDAVFTSVSNGVGLMLNDGNGGFAEPRYTNVGSDPRALAVGDFNGDGKLDLLVKSKTSGLGILAGDGAGFFTETVSGIAAEFNDPRFVVGDFNGDGKPDLAVAQYAGFMCNSALAGFVVYTGDGMGGFTRTGTASAPTPVEYPIAADLNADGRADLIYSSACGTQEGVYVLLAEDGGGFGQHVKYDAGDAPRRVSTGDLNGDGNPDLIVANTKSGDISGNVYYLIGKGDGTFNNAVELRTGQTPAVIIPADFNDDGATDLAVLRSTNATFSVLFNRPYDITPAMHHFSGAGGTGTVNVNAGCAWTAVSNTSWVQVSAGADGSGNGTVSFHVDANTGVARQGTITIAGKTFTVKQGTNFADVATESVFYEHIGKLSAAGITLGCGIDQMGNPLYCPNQVVTREQMAAFLLRALGEFNPPAPTSQRFSDVPPENGFYAFIDRLAALGITLGCNPQGTQFCPGSPVTREQAAAFILRVRGEFSPPTPFQQYFNDVPPNNFFYAFIDRLRVLGITLGCSASLPLYCPSSLTTREEMAAFLVRAFGL